MDNISWREKRKLPGNFVRCASTPGDKTKCSRARFGWACPPSKAWKWGRYWAA